MSTDPRVKVHHQGGSISADPRVKAEQLRESIASRAAGIRRDVVKMASAAASRQPGRISVRGIPSWALAAAVGAAAGLVTALRRRSSNR